MGFLLESREAYNGRGIGMLKWVSNGEGLMGFLMGFAWLLSRFRLALLFCFF